MESLPQRTALIVIDVQEGWSDPKWGKRNNPEAEIKIAFLIEAWRRTERPVIHVRHISKRRGSVFAIDGPGSALKALVAPKGNEPVILKHENSSFIGTDLEQRLRDADIGDVVITGLTTDHCVSTTARMAGNFEFKTYFVADATATFERTGPNGEHYSAQLVHDVNLASLHGEFATVVNTAEVIEAALAAVPTFT